VLGAGAVDHHYPLRDLVRGGAREQLEELRGGLVEPIKDEEEALMWLEARGDLLEALEEERLLLGGGFSEAEVEVVVGVEALVDAVEHS